MRGYGLRCPCMRRWIVALCSNNVTPSNGKGEGVTTELEYLDMVYGKRLLIISSALSKPRA